MHTVKYTKVEPSYKNYHIDMYFKTKTVVAHAVKCWTQWHMFTSIQSYATLTVAVANASKPQLLYVCRSWWVFTELT